MLEKSKFIGFFPLCWQRRRCRQGQWQHQPMLRPRLCSLGGIHLLAGFHQQDASKAREKPYAIFLDTVAQRQVQARTAGRRIERVAGAFDQEALMMQGIADLDGGIRLSVAERSAVAVCP